MSMAGEVPSILQGDGFALVARLGAMALQRDPAVVEVALGRDCRGALTIWCRVVARERPRKARERLSD